MTDFLKRQIVRLSPMSPDVMSCAYSLATSEASGYRWRWAGSLPSVSEFPSAFLAGSYAVFGVRSSRSNNILGVVSAYGAHLLNGSVFVETIVAEDAKMFGAGVSATLEIISWLFESRGFQKVYFESIEYNVHQFSRIEKFGATLEVRMRQHYFSLGRYWDRLVFGLSRSDYLQALSTYE